MLEGVSRVAVYLCCLCVLVYSLPHRHRRSPSVECREHPVEPCVMERNPVNARINLSPIYDTYACVAGGNTKNNHELHVLSAFFARNNSIDVYVQDMPLSAPRAVRLVLMSHDAITWNIYTHPDVNITSVDLISLSVSNSSVKLNGADPPTLYRKAGFFGFGMRKSQMKNLRHFLMKKNYGEMTSFAGSVTASEWTLRTGNNYDCESVHSKTHSVCSGRDLGFHGDNNVADFCEEFILCSGEHSYVMKCRDKMHWSLETRQCEPPTEDSCGSQIYKEENACLLDEKCWSSFPFHYDDSLTSCDGDQYVSFMREYQLYVGVVLCNETTYNILLSEKLRDKFLPVADSRGFGEDHCEFVGASTIQMSTDWTSIWNTTITNGYFRADWSEKPEIGLVGTGKAPREWTGKFYPTLYRCGDTKIPGDFRVESVPLKMKEFPAAEQVVDSGGDVTVTCSANYPHVEYTWSWIEEGKNTTSKVFPNGVSILGNILRITNFDGSKHSGKYICTAILSSDGIERERTSKSTKLTLTKVECHLGLTVLDVSHNEIEGSIGEALTIRTQTDEAVYQFVWYKDGIRLPGDTGTLAIPCFTEKNSGEYRVSAYKRSATGSCVDEKSVIVIPRGCGVTEQRQRIIAGTDALRGSAPWMVSMSTSHVKRFCGAVLLNSRWVATAAHCLNNELFLTRTRKELGEINVRFAYYDTQQEEGTYDQKDVKRVIIHSDYNGNNSFDNDIALMELKHPVILSDGITPACPATLRFPNPNFFISEGGRVTGWGNTVRRTGRGRPAKTLQQLRMRVTECRRGNDMVMAATDNMFCAVANNADTCDGDSGSPFVQWHHDRHYLTGLVSHGPADCQGQTVYTKVASYFDWIYDVINEGVCAN